MKVLRTILLMLFLAVIAVFLSRPKTYMQSFLDGVTVWAYNILPALFPFAVLTGVAVKFLPDSRFSPCKLLFGVRADRLYLMSLLCGYPVGAKCVAESTFDTDTATQICSFCSSASPVFIIATVGAKLLQNTAATAILMISHLLSTLINGLFHRKNCADGDSLPTTLSAGNIGSTVTDSILSVLSVGGLVALFYMLTDMLRSFLPAAISQSAAVGFCIGLLEMSNGIIAVSRSCNLFCATVLSSFLLSFGGMCVFAQCYTFLAAKQISAKKLLIMKFFQASVATLLSCALGKLFL